MEASQRSWRGMVMGGFGDDVQIISEEGLDDLTIRSATAALPRYHGSIPGDHTADAKRIILTMWWMGGTVAESEQIGLEVRALFQPSRETQYPYGFQHAFGPEGFVNARVLRRSQPRSIRTESGMLFQMSVELEVVDPALYAAELLSAILEPFAVATGFSWDAVWPISWGAGGSGGGVTVTNEGEWETWPTFMINGPSSGTLTNPIIENVTTGQRLALNANGGVSIASGQILEISTHPGQRYVRFDSGASRYGRLSTDSEFFPLQPGPNELRFRASGDTTGATVDVQARSAWI